MSKRITEFHIWKVSEDSTVCLACGTARTEENDKAACPVAVDRLAKRCRAAYDRLIEPLREVARQHGYAIGVHGSLARDIDLIACPWTKEACDAAVLVEALRAEAERICGWAALHAAERGEYFVNGCPGFKPHGRRVWSYHLGGGPYIDLSVMPARTQVD